jgi:AraC family transcriptional regulator, glycine betaine-responsive activator
MAGRRRNSSDARHASQADAPPAGAPTTVEPVELAFLLIPQFSLLSFSAAIEPLRSANRLSGHTLYRWQLASLDGEPVVASNGIPIAVHVRLDALTKPDMLVVCAALDPLQTAGNRALRAQLKYLAQRGCKLGAISAGSFVLADAGVLADRLCTVHWEYMELFAARFPQLRLAEELYVVDRDVFTCSGGVAALDMMLGFVREQGGADLALAVAEQFLHPRIRGRGDHQRMELRARYGLYDETLIEAVRLMQQTIEAPLSVKVVAARVRVSPRQLERLFRRYIGAAPAPFYLRLRLERCRELLQQTAKTVREVAIAGGFRSTSNFAHAYKRQFGRTSSEERKASLPGPAPGAARTGAGRARRLR